MIRVYESYGKRLLDILGALVLIIVLSPVMLVFCLLLAFNRPIFFIQQRAGRKGVLFPLIKFRSMNLISDADGNPLPDAQRLTRFGRLIRKYSIDEFPQLFNVLLGHISLVGPRPLLPEYLPLYSEEQAKRHLVRPGITGLAQILGRNSLSWSERFQLDVQYVEKLSFFLDFKIILITPFVVFAGRGVQHRDGEMPPFRGPEDS